MNEMSANPTIQKAFDRAHNQRAEALRSAWVWLFSSKASR